MTVKSSQDLWIEPTAPLGDATEVTGPFGGVCAAIGPDAKKSDTVCCLQNYIYVLMHQLREPAHVLDLRTNGCRVIFRGVGSGGVQSAP